jgi:hypothetical protein
MGYLKQRYLSAMSKEDNFSLYIQRIEKPKKKEIKIQKQITTTQTQ